MNNPNMPQMTPQGQSPVGQILNDNGIPTEEQVKKNRISIIKGQQAESNIPIDPETGIPMSNLNENGNPADPLGLQSNPPAPSAPAPTPAPTPATPGVDPNAQPQATPPAQPQPQPTHPLDPTQQPSANRRKRDAIDT